MHRGDDRNPRVQAGGHRLHLLHRADFIEHHHVGRKAPHRLLDSRAFGAVEQHVAVGQPFLGGELPLSSTTATRYRRPRWPEES